MSYNLIIKALAKSQIENAAADYGVQREGLDLVFWETVENALQNIASNPLGYQIKYKTFRTKWIKPFPFLLIFEIIENDVVVYQCFPAQSNPSKKYGHK